MTRLRKGVVSHTLIVRYGMYCERIRMSYAFSPLPSYSEKFLSSMVAAPSTYKSAELKKFAAAARSNCSRAAVVRRRPLARRAVETTKDQ